MASALALHLVAKAETAEEVRRVNVEWHSHEQERISDNLRLRNVQRHQAAADAISLWMTYNLVGQLVREWMAEHG